jgi:hypothetical protein
MPKEEPRRGERSEWDPETLLEGCYDAAKTMSEQQ